MASGELGSKGRQTRTAIELAARKLFAERGFHGTTLADITSAAGKSPAVFYRYFTDKEDLLAALAESFLHDVVEPSGLNLHLPDSPDDAEFFTSVVTGYWNMFKQNIGIMIAVAQLAATQQRFAEVQNSSAASASTSWWRRCAVPRSRGTRWDSCPSTSARRSHCCSRTSPRCSWGHPGSVSSSTTAKPSRPSRRSGRKPCTAFKEINVDFTLPEHLRDTLAEMDAFIEAEIKPLERENIQYFDHRREHARTDWDNGGVPRREWEELLDEMRRRADAAGWLRYGLPARFGGRDGTNLDMAVIREHLAHKGLGLHNDLQDESSIVGNFPQVIMMDRFGTETQKDEWVEAMITGKRSMAFGLTEPGHGSDATWLETTAVRDGEDWIINGTKRWNTGVHRATHDLIFARTSGERGQALGITAFLVPTDAPGFHVPFYWWTFNMPTDHGEVELTNVRVPADAVLGEVDRGLEVGQTFLHENRIRQAASSLGAAQYCIDRAVTYAGEREVFGKPLAVNQAVQWPLVELQTEAQMVRLLVYYAATQLDANHHMEVSDKVSMANYRANRLVCEAADRAMQVHGGIGYSRHEPFEHIYRHHRRYRITEGAEEIQMRRVAQRLFGFGRAKK